MTAQTVQLFADIAALGKHRCFLRDARGINGRGAKQILQARLQPPRECRAQLHDQGSHLVGLFADMRKPCAKIVRQVTAFGAAHFIQLSQSVEQAAFQFAAEFFLFFFGLWPGRRQTANDAGEAQQRYDVQSCGNRSLKAQFIGGAQIIRDQVFVHLDRSGHSWFYADVHFDVSAMDAFADDLTKAQLVQVKSFGQAYFQIQEAMIDALHADPKIPAQRAALGLRVSCHGETLGFFGLYCALFAHLWFLVADVEGSGGKLVCTGAAISSSANCKSCNRAYVPALFISSACVPISRIWPSSSTRILSARRIVARRCAITNVVLPTIKLASAFCTNISDSASSSEVASSNIRMGESLRMARAMAIR